MVKIKKLRDDLEGDEKATKERLPEKVYKVNKKKKILLMQRLLKRISYPDLEVVHKCLYGLEMDTTGVFEQRPLGDFVVGADPLWLARQARTSRKALIEKIK